MIRFKIKAGVGAHYQNTDAGRVLIKRGTKNEIVTVEFPSELGGAIDKFDQLDPTPPPRPLGGDFTLKPRGGGWHDVIGPDGTAVNSKGLREEDALLLVNQMIEAATIAEEKSEADSDDSNEQPEQSLPLAPSTTASPTATDSPPQIETE